MVDIRFIEKCGNPSTLDEFGNAIVMWIQHNAQDPSHRMYGVDLWGVDWRLWYNKRLSEFTGRISVRTKKFTDHKLCGVDFFSGTNSFVRNEMSNVTKIHDKRPPWKKIQDVDYLLDDEHKSDLYRWSYAISCRFWKELAKDFEKKYFAALLAGEETPPHTFFWVDEGRSEADDMIMRRLSQNKFVNA